MTEQIHIDGDEQVALCGASAPVLRSRENRYSTCPACSRKVLLTHRDAVAEAIAAIEKARGAIAESRPTFIGASRKAETANAIMNLDTGLKALEPVLSLIDRTTSFLYEKAMAQK